MITIEVFTAPIFFLLNYRKCPSLLIRYIASEFLRGKSNETTHTKRVLTLLMVNTYQQTCAVMVWQFTSLIVCDLTLFLSALRCEKSDIIVDTKTVWQFTFSAKYDHLHARRRTHPFSVFLFQRKLYYSGGRDWFVGLEIN